MRTTLSSPISKVERHSSSSSPSKGPIPTLTGLAALTYFQTVPPFAQTVNGRVDPAEARQICGQWHAFGAPQ